ncbi:MAG TPA: hypothetical protein PLF23_18665 [Candidatus Obscuribacter sp.]|nr:hypothetical protein [Candidatus Obscuribacter sp.]
MSASIKGKRPGWGAFFREVSVALACCLFLGLFLPTWAAEKTVPVWLLKQTDYAAGRYSLYVGDEAVRLEGFCGRACVVARAPKWEVVAFNRDGYYYPMTLEYWNKVGLGGNASDLRVIFKDLSRAKTSKTVMFKLPCLRVEKRVRFVGEDNAFSTMPRNSVEEGTLAMTLTSDLKLSREALMFVRGVYKIPPTGGFLLSFSRGNMKKEESVLRTESITMEKAPLSLFAVPGRLKLAKTLNSIIYGKEAEDMMLDMSGAALH